ncbi:type IV conjugative transfer system protein TraE [Nitrosomonas eutropha]|uniref:type IV conjugative transfer system protein TraE n=1 Tax=Nitrosomonas eutropha TaxID=916 RepID=UPI0008B93D39|nr:type IV conjugative transfer system protein TraE [Nitrosomonas eutropha]SEJ01736.1 conjugal transfer pilus assembly protein TraE [Nitrosomonas eutropha]
MFFRKYISEKDNAAQEISFLRILAAGLVVAAVVQAAANISLSGDARTVITPPNIKQGFWVTTKSVSSEYLEEMAYWYTGLALNITPAGITYQNELFLKYAAPSEYGRLQQEMVSRSEFLKKNQISSQFAVEDISVDSKRMRVALTGKLYTWVAEKRAGMRDTTFMIGFQYINGKLYISDFRETNRQDIFGDTRTDKQS